jgi:integrase
MNDRDMLRLRWSHIGKRHSLNLGIEDTRSNRAYAMGIARQIDDDIRCGQFDPSKNKYRPQTIGQTGLFCSDLFSRFADHKERELGVSIRSIETRYQPVVVALDR